MRATGCLLIAILVAPSLPAQSPITFDVASLRLNRSLSTTGASYQTLPGGRLVVHNTPLEYIVAAAYGLYGRSPRIIGNSRWRRLRFERFDIEAAAPRGSIPLDTPPAVLREKVHRMLQALLADRLKIKLARQTKKMRVYAIVVAPGGPKLRSGAIEEKDCGTRLMEGGGGCHMVIGGVGRGIVADSATVADVAQFVENWTDRPVIDETGIAGLFQFHTEGWSPMRPMPPHDGPAKGGNADLLDPSRPTLFEIFDKLGLKIESRKAPVEVLRIEHVESPAAN